MASVWMPNVRPAGKVIAVPGKGRASDGNGQREKILSEAPAPFGAALLSINRVRRRPGLVENR